MYQKIPNPELAHFLSLNPTPSLAYLPDTGRDWFVNLYLRDYRENLVDLLTSRLVPTDFHVYRESADAILRATFHTGSPLGDYWAETEFRAGVPEQAGALRRLLSQPELEIHIVDKDLYYLTSKLYRGTPLGRFRAGFEDFAR